MHGGDPAAAEQVEPAPHPLGDGVGERVASGVELGRRCGRGSGERERADPAAALGLLQRLEQGLPLVRGRGGQHASPPLTTDGTPAGGQRCWKSGACLRRVHQNRHVARADAVRPSANVAPWLSSRGDVVGEVVGDPAPKLADGDVSSRR